MEASGSNETAPPALDEHDATETADEHARRVGANEAIFREVNEQIEKLNHSFAAAGEETIQIVCECGALSCAAMLSVPAAEYERVRSEATLFFVVAGHQDAAVEDVVDRNDGSYSVVRKHAGPAREIADATDPRAERNSGSARPTSAPK